jgi:hypothetical protein
MTYDNTNTGLLAKNERKEQPKHPDMSGSINVEGVEYWLSGWVKTGRPGTKMEGKKFYSLAVRRKDDARSAAPARAPADSRSTAAPAEKFDDDDIPF